MNNSPHQKGSGGMNPPSDYVVSAAALNTAAAVAAISGSYQSSMANVDLNSNFVGKYGASPPLSNSLSRNAEMNGHVNSANSTPMQNLHAGGSASAGSGNPNFLNNPSGPGNMQISSFPFGAHNKVNQRPASNNSAQSYSAFTMPVPQPQHLRYNSIHTYQHFRRPAQEEKPLVFQKMPLRRGKWMPDEERYAKSLIDAFEKGIINGCENGCTLRAYLSRKLHCQPMRISKKYAGKSIGKQVYMSRLNALPPASKIPVEVNQELEKLALAFQMSIAQEGMAHGIGANLSIGSAPSSCNGSAVSLQMKTLSTGGSQLSNASVGQPITNSARNNVWPQHFIPQANGMMPVQQANPAMQVNSFGNSQNIQQQNLFNAFQQAKISYGQTEKKPNTNITAANASVPDFPSFSTSINYPARSHEISNEERSIPPLNQTTSTSPDKLTIGQAQQNWLNETMPMIATLDPTLIDGRCTPTKTSESFDNLHQFLGKDCPSSNEDYEQDLLEEIGQGGPATDAANKMNAEANQNASLSRLSVSLDMPGSKLNHMGIAGDTSDSRIFVHAADEYSFFAQQSAIEASKHSAYFRDDMPPPKPTPVFPVPRKRQISCQQTPSATFNIMNLKRHGKESQAETNTSDSMHSRSSMPLVSESDRSSSEIGTEYSAIVSTMGSSSTAGSGSSNDGSDMASDEGRSSADSLQQNNKRKRNLNYSGGLQREKIAKF